MLNRMAKLLWEAGEEKSAVSNTPADIRVEHTFTAPIPAAWSGVSNPELKGIILTSLKKDNTQLPLVEFVAVLEQMSDVIPDEPTRFKAALKMSKLSLVAIAESLRSTETLIAKEKSNFGSSAITPLKDKIASNVQTSKDITTQIEDLTKNIAELSDKRNSLNAECVELTSKVGQLESSFAVTSGEIVSERTTFLSKVTTYLGA